MNQTITYRMEQKRTDQISYHSDPILCATYTQGPRAYTLLAPNILRKPNHNIFGVISFSLAGAGTFFLLGPAWTMQGMQHGHSKTGD
jgi:hypothetical protein